jgi:hypothetical protein
MTRVVPIAFLVSVLTVAGAPVSAGDGVFPVSTLTPSDPERRLNPVIAYNNRHDEYLVVWVNEWSGGHEDIYAQRIASNGDFIGSWYCVSCGANDRRAPDVAYDWSSDQYLLVWMYDASGNDTRWEVRGKLLPWNGPGTNPELIIHSDNSYTGWHPSVAHDPIRSRFMVIWEMATTGIGVDLLYIAGRMVETNGTLGTAGGVSDGIFAYQSDITYNLSQDEYLLVWRQDEWVTTPGPHWEYQIIGSRMTGSGSRLGGEFSVSGASGNERGRPRVTTDTQNIFFVVWEEKVGLPPVEWDVHGMFLPSTDPAFGTPGGFAIADSTEDETRPEVVATSMDGTFNVLYQEPRSVTDSNQRLSRAGYSATWTGSGFIALLTPLPPLFDQTGASALNPVATASAHESVVVFRRDPESAGLAEHIYGWSHTVLRDGFETGNTSRWTSQVP